MQMFVYGSQGESVRALLTTTPLEHAVRMLMSTTVICFDQID
jgi:hypothetical protein